MIDAISAVSTASQLCDAVWEECRLVIEFWNEDSTRYAGQTKLANVAPMRDRFPLRLPTLDGTMKVSEAENLFARDWGVQIQILQPSGGRQAHNDAAISRYGFRVWSDEPQLNRLVDKSTVGQLCQAFETDYGIPIEVIGRGALTHIGSLLESTPPADLSLNADMTVVAAADHIRLVWGIDVRILDADRTRAVSKMRRLEEIGFRSRRVLEAPAIAASAPEVVIVELAAQSVSPRVKRAARSRGMVERLERCPYPLAMALYRAELNGGTDWNFSMAALHCAMRILALPIVALAANRDSSKEDVAKVLKAPSWGTWNDALDKLSRELADVHPWAKTVQADLSKKLKDPSALELAKCFGEYASKPFQSESVQVRELFKSHVTYRNATEGHGTVPRGAPQERHARAMFEGACSIVDNCDAIRLMRIVEVKSCEETREGVIIDALEWVGLRPLRVDGLSSVGFKVQKNAILMAPESGDWITLDGWLLHGDRPSGDELLFFNGIKNSSPTYLTFHNGLTLHETGAAKGDGKTEYASKESELELRPPITREPCPALNRLKTKTRLNGSAPDDA